MASVGSLGLVGSIGGLLSRNYITSLRVHEKETIAAIRLCTVYPFRRDVHESDCHLASCVRALLAPRRAVAQLSCAGHAPHRRRQAQPLRARAEDAGWEARPVGSLGAPARPRQRILSEGN